MDTLTRGTSAARHTAPDASAMTRVMRGLFLRLLRRRRNTLAIAHLESLDDYLLTDIGLTRHEVSAMAGHRQSVRWQHPTQLW